MKYKKLKLVVALCLGVFMAVKVSPHLPGSIDTVHAAMITPPQFATKDELLSNYKMDGTGTVATIYFGELDREWLIAGKDAANGTNTLALLSRTTLGDSSYGINSRYSDSDIAKVFLPNCVSDLITFSASEVGYMKDTTVSTVDWTGTSSSVTGKLYIPNSYDRAGTVTDRIYVGSGNQIPILLSYLDSSQYFNSFIMMFMLRSPDNSSSTNIKAVYSIPEHDINYTTIGSNASVLPALDLDLSSVLFASTANPATSEGALFIDTAFTLRFASTTLGTATIDNSANKVAVASAPAGTYLVVQNNDGAWAKAVNGSATVNAADVTIDGSVLTDFTNCKVWLEKTDAAERITTATLGVVGTIIDTPPATTPTSTPTDSTTSTATTTVSQTPTYVITEGANGVYQVGSDGAQTITCSGALAELTGIYLDGSLVDASNYTLKSGSTILTLKPEYLSTLGAGTHTLTFQYGTNTAETTIQITDTAVAKADTATLSAKDDVPKTGDSTPIVGLIGLALISGGGILHFGRKKKSLEK